MTTLALSMSRHVDATFGFHLQGGATAVLLIHGLGGTPAEMRTTGRYLHAAGLTVRAVKLAGHCGTIDDLVATRWHDWCDSVRTQADDLVRAYGPIYVVGLSMGALLALDYGIHSPRNVAGVVALAPTFDHDGWSMPWYSRLGRWLLPLFKTLGIGRTRIALEAPPYGVKNARMRARIASAFQSGNGVEAGLPGTPWFALAEMYGLVRSVKHRLTTLSRPCLVIHAEEDDVASPANASLIAAKVRQAPVNIVWLNDSYHLIVIDQERRKVSDAIVRFIQR